MLQAITKLSVVTDVTILRTPLLCCNHKPSVMSQSYENQLNTETVLQAITKPFNYAIVDEVDSLLIDSCRDPLMISAASSENLDRFGVAKEVTFCTPCTPIRNTVCNPSVHHVPPSVTQYV